MPKGPKGEKRPADAIGAAIRVAKIATGEIEEEDPDEGKNPLAVAAGWPNGRALGDDEKTIFGILTRKLQTQSLHRAC